MTGRILAGLLAFLALATPARADMIVNVPLGTPGAPSIGGPTDQYLYASWTQPIEYTDVTIVASIWTNDPAFNQGTAWITQQVGPGTPSGSELASAAVTFPLFQNPVAPTQLFSGLTLAPGTWYLILSSPEDGLHLAWNNGGAATTAPGVTTNPTGLTAGMFANTGYAPASTWGTYPGLSYAVRGTPVETVPEPAMALLFGAAGLVLARRRRGLQNYSE